MLLLPVVCADAQERERLRHRLAGAGESAAARTPAMAVCVSPPAAPARDAHDGLMRQVKPSRVAASLAQRSATTVLEPGGLCRLVGGRGGVRDAAEELQRARGSCDVERSGGPRRDMYVRQTASMPIERRTGRPTRHER